MADGWEDAPGQWEDAPSRRTPPTKLKIGAEGFKGAMEEVLKEHPVAGRVAAFGSFPRQLYEGAKQALGFEDKQAIQATRAMEETYPLSALGGGLATAGLAAFVPGGSSLLGQAAFGGVTGALQPTEGNESRAKAAGIGAATAGLFGGGVKLAGLGAKALLSRSAQKALEKGAEHTVRDATLAEARAAGYVVPRSATGEGGAVNKAVESVAGKAALGQESSIRNQQVTNAIARSEAGLGQNEPITEASLEAARARIAAPYREIAALSPKAAKALEDMKAARAEAKLYHREYDSTQRVAALKKAERLDDKASAAEDIIMQEAGSVMKSDTAQAAKGADTLQRLRDARTALAKNYQVERALNLGNGNIDAAVIGRMYDKVGDRGMTGGLRTIGKFQQAFPTFAREKPAGQVAPGIGALKPYAAALALGVGANEPHAQRYGLSPYMLGAAGLTLAGGPARSLALSRFGQRAPSYTPGMSVRLADLATNDPRLRSLIPLASGAVAAHEAQQ